MASDAERAIDLAKKATRKAVQQEDTAEVGGEIDEESMRERGQLAVVEADEENLARRPFTITKFARHPDGYFHARVTPLHGAAIYVHCKFGSWMAPGETGKGKPVLKDVLPRVAAELSRRARAQEKAERAAREPPVA